MLRLTSALWFWTTLALSVALVLAILLLPPWSPVSMTSGAGSESSSRTGALAQSGSAPATIAPLATPIAGALAPVNSAPGPTLGATGTVPPAASTQVSFPTPSDTPLAAANPKLTTTHAASESPPNHAAEARPTPGFTPEVTEPEDKASPNSAAAEVPAQPAGEETAPLTLEELIRATKSPDWKTRWDAVNDLGNLKDPKAIPSLASRAHYDDNSHPRWRSLWSLASVLSPISPAHHACGYLNSIVILRYR
ncbi:MAG: HEAT repeat domain-containing protein [Stenotrophomonas maltophilia]